PRRSAVRRVPLGQHDRQPGARQRRRAGAARSALGDRRRDVRRAGAVHGHVALRRAFLLAATLATSACTAMSTIKTATTVAKGGNQGIGALEADGRAPREVPGKTVLPELGG